MKPLIALAISAVMLTGCSKSVDSKSKTFTYPLTLGNQWTYSVVGTWEHGDPPQLDTLLTLVLRVIVERIDTVPPGVPSYITRETVVGSAILSEISEHTYLNLPEGMYRLLRKSAPEDVARMLPRPVPPALGIVFSDPRLAEFPNSHGLAAALADPAGLITAQTADVADTLPLVLAYPQHVGLFWTYHDSGGVWSSWVNKVIEGRETITTPAGSFDCWRIRTIYGAPLDDTQIMDYISAEGLIQRRVEIGNPIDKVVLTSDLTSFKLY